MVGQGCINAHTRCRSPFNEFRHPPGDILNSGIFVSPPLLLSQLCWIVNEGLVLLLIRGLLRYGNSRLNGLAPIPGGSLPAY